MTPEPGAWPVLVAVLGPFEAGTMLWRVSGQSMVTVIAKACCTLVPDGELALAEPQPIVRNDALFSHQPMDGVRRAGELAPQLHAVDVTLTGHAYPGTPGAAQACVRFGLHAPTGPLFDKVLHVYGDIDRRTGVMNPIERMPLNYARTYGGIGYGSNPLGVGFGGEGDRAPNVFDPRDPTIAAGFVPIPAAFPIRRALLGKAARLTITRGVLELPDGFDWTYFQAAPSDQRVLAVRGGEWLVLDGVFEERPGLCTRVPSWRLAAKVYDGAAAGAPELVPLRLDMLHVDADARTCDLVFRGSFPVGDFASIGAIAVAIGLDVPGVPIDWPATKAELPLTLSTVSTAGDVLAAPGAPAPPSRFVDSLELTRQLVMVGAPELSPFARPALPSALPKRVPSAPANPVSAHPFAGTTTLDPAILASLGAATPFAMQRSESPQKSAIRSMNALPWAESAAAPSDATPFVDLGQTIDASAVEDAHRKRDRARSKEAVAAAEADARLERERLDREASDAEATADAELAEAARIDAEARHIAAAERFRGEQEEAKRLVEQRAAEKLEAKRAQAAQMKSGLYGVFRRKS
ncbi:MAG: DUF2169 domain-containing protein [Myxococcales bacterium]|nr:DUF2169 domain-containing protein [Myxococcales bacterium]